MARAAGWMFLGWLLLAGACLLAPGRAAAQAENAPVALRDALRTLDAQPLARAWVDPRGDATLADVASRAGRARFQAAPPTDAMYQLGPQSALWLHLRLQRAADGRQDWLLEFPMPVLDHVTVFQRDATGWHHASAGDTLAVASWPEPGRYPLFRLDLPPGQERDVFVRIRHTTAANFPIHLSTASANAQRTQVEYVGLGIAFGALLLLIAACAAQSWAYGDRVYAGYAVYAGLTLLAVASFTGAAAHLLWPGFGALKDAPMPMLASAAGGAGLLFVRNLLGLRRRFKLQDRLVYGMGMAGFALALLPPFLSKTTLMPLLAVYMVLTTVGIVAVALAAWRRGDVVGKWVCAAYVPMTLSIVATFLRVFGWFPVSVGSQYAVVIAMAVEVPLLLVALTMRSRARHGAEIREQALTTHDALTGLLAPHLFQDRLRQVISRYKRDGQSAAIMFIDLVNHDRIKATFGTSVAEQSLLRSVIKLRRQLRDVDTVSRMGEARFGVILEGASVRASVTDRCARLIAAGLMPLPGLKPDVTLQFHCAALMLNERQMEADDALEALDGQLSHMSPRTRRPIRFIVPEAAQPQETGHDSSLFAPDSDMRRSRPPLQAVR